MILEVGSWHLDTSACWRPTIWLIKMRMVGIRINMRKKLSNPAVSPFHQPSTL
mgnify:CR=1 FL=1